MTENNTQGAQAEEVEVQNPQTEIRILNQEDQEQLDAQAELIKQYMIDNPAKNLIGISEEEKDAKYVEITGMWNKFAETLKKSRFMLPLTAQEFAFVKTAITKHIEYTDTTVFIGFRVMQDFLEPGSVYSHAVTSYVHQVTPDTMVLIYHLLTQHKVTGLGMSAINFKNVLERLGSISRVFEKYDQLSKDLSGQVKNWVVGLDEDSHINAEAPTAEALPETTEG